MMDERSLSIRREFLTFLTNQYPNTLDVIATIYTSAPSAFSSRFEFDAPITRVIHDVGRSTDESRKNQMLAREAASHLNQLNWGLMDDTTPEFWNDCISHVRARFGLDIESSVR